MRIPSNSTKKRMNGQTCSISNDELEVSEILLQIPELIVTKEMDVCSFKSSWGLKRKRCAIDSNPSPPHHSLSSTPSPPPFPSLLPCSGNGNKASIKVESCIPATPLHPHSSNGNKSSIKVESYSATTLLLLPHIDSVSKPKVFLKRKKMAKQDLLESVQRSTETSIILKQEIPKMKAQLEILKHTNSMLKQIGEELLSCRRQNVTNFYSSPKEFPSQAPSKGVEEGEIAVGVSEKTQLEIRRLTSGIGTSVSCSSVQPNGLKCFSSVLLSGTGLGKAEQLSMFVLPDLKLSEKSSLGENSFQSHDVSKAAMAAQARKRRININRYRVSLTSVKPRYR